MPGAWDVIEEAPTRAAPAVGEWDVAAEAPVKPKRQVGAGEATARAGSSLLNSANAYAAMPAVGIARLLDAANSLFGLRKDQPGYTEMVGDKFVVPSMVRANEAAINPATETAGAVGDVAIPVASELGKAVPDLVMGGGLATAAPKAAVRTGESALRAVAQKLIDNSVVGMPAGFRRAGERQLELRDAGVDPVSAAAQATASGAMTAGQFALPVSAGSAAASLPMRVASRGAQGAGLGTSAGLVAQQAENAMAPDTMQQPVMTPENIIPQLVLNAIFGQMGGRNPKGGAFDRKAMGYDKPGDVARFAEIQPPEPAAPREPAPVVHDPAEAAKLVTEALFRTGPDAPLAPDLKILPRGEETSRTSSPVRSAADVASVNDALFRLPDATDGRTHVSGDLEAQPSSISGRLRRTLDTPPIEPSNAPSVRTTEHVAASTDAMRPDVPMRILHTIADAARDSGLESRITPRITRPAEKVPPAAVVKESKPADQQPAQQPQQLFDQPAGKVTTERPPEVIPGGQHNTSGEATLAGRESQPQPAQPQQAKKPPKAAPDKMPGSAFLQEVKKAGGIDPAFAAEVGGDSAMQLNRRLPGLMRKGGLSEDGLLEWAQQNGYLNDAEIANADRNLPGGGLQLAKDLMRKALNGEDVHTAADAEGAYARAAEERARNEQDYHDYRMQNDPEYRAEQQRMLSEATKEYDLPPQSEADVDLIARAASIDDVAVERLAQQADGGGITEQQFMDGIRRIVNGEHNSAKSTGGKAAEQPAPAAPASDASAAGGRDNAGEVRPADGSAQQPGADKGAARPDLQLERPSEQQLRQRDAEQRRTDEQRRSVENAPPASDFTLTGSNRTADEAAARGQKDIFTPDEEKKAGGGGTLSANPFANPKVISEALGWVFGDAKAWHDSIGKFANDIREAISKVPSVEGHPVARFLRAVFDSASGDMRAALKNAKSDTARWVVDQFHTEAGTDRVTKEIYSSAVNSWTNKQMSALDAGIKMFEGNSPALAQIAALVRNPAGIKPGTKIHDAAATIRGLLDGALKHMRDAGVDVGEVKDGYYPREFDMRAVMRDPKAFIDAAAQAFREGGMPVADAMASAKQLHDGMVYGESGSIFRTDKGSPQAPFMKGRVFGKQVDSEKHPLNAFLMHDPSQAIPIYLERAAKRAEIARRFGDNFEKWGEIEKKIIAEGGGAALEKLRDYVTLAAKLKSPGVSNFALRTASIARTWGSLMFLEKATLSSLTEFIVPAIRTGNVLDMGRSLKNTLADLFTKTHSAEERRAFAEDLGIISAHLSDQVSAARFSGGEPVSMLESKILAKYFRRTGLTQWTDATFVSAADLGRVFIRRLSKELEGGGGKLNDRYLAELGVPKEKAAEFSKYVLSKNDGILTAGDMAGPMGDLYRAAVRRFAQQSIMRPDATLRPGWMAHPLGSIVGQLQSFNYAFFENVLKRNARLAKEAATGADYTMIERARLVMPTLMLPMLVGAAYAIGEARDSVFGDPEKRKEETKGQKVLKAMSRGAPIAPLDPLINYASSAKYQRSAADNFAGPVLGTAGKGMDAARQVLLNNTPKTNTAERQAAKAVYDIFIEPTVNLMLTASPVTLAAAAATQAAGAGGVREKFVSAVAGPAKKSPPRGAASVITK